jgi:hypothetical protein
MKTRFLKIIFDMAFATVLALTVTQISAFAQPAQKRQGIEGVWDVRVTVVQCDTGKAILTGRAILMFSDGGGFTEITDNHLHPTGLGTWRHLGGRSYTAVDNNFMYNADGSLAGTIVVNRDIELNANSDEYTATATSEIFNTADQLISTGCATSTATRLE